MGRLVRVPRVFPSSFGSGYRVDAAGYLERVVKYVPAEVIALTMLSNAILDQAIRTYGFTGAAVGLPISAIATSVLIAGTVLTPLFVFYIRGQGDAWITHAIVSTLVYPFWAYALSSAKLAGYWEVNFKLTTTYAPDGSAAQSGFLDGNLAAMLLIAMTVLSGLITPRLQLGTKPESSVRTADHSLASATRKK